MDPLVCSAITSDLSTNCANRSSTSSGSMSSPAATASAASSVNPPANTESRSSSDLLGRAEQVVGPVDGGAQRLVALERRAAAPGEEPKPLIEAIVRALTRSSSATRAAASSIASGMPSSRSHSRRHAPARHRRSARSRPARQRRASAKSRDASSSRERWTATIRSPRSASPSRLVASTVTFGHSRSIRSTRSRHRVEHVLTVVEHEQQLLRARANR